MLNWYHLYVLQNSFWYKYHTICNQSVAHIPLTLKEKFVDGAEAINHLHAVSGWNYTMINKYIIVL